MVRWYFLFFQSQKIVTYFYHLITQIVMCVRHARAPLLFDLLQNKLLAERNSVEGFICQLRYIIVRTPPPPSPPALFKGGGESKFWLSWNYGTGAGPLKRGGEGGLTLFLFNFFKVYHFYI